MGDPRIIVYTQARDGEHITQWVYHYLKFFHADHVFIYDDRSDVPIERLLETLESEMRDKTTVRRIDVDFSDDDRFKSTATYDPSLRIHDMTVQAYYMNLFIHHELAKFVGDVGEVDDCWVMFIDCDEFLYCLDDGAGLRSILRGTLEDAVYIPWLMYNTSMHVDLPETGPIVLNYRYHAHGLDTLGKSVARVSSLLNASGAGSLIRCPHMLYIENSWTLRRLESDLTYIHLAHYHMLSVKTFIRRKLLRGSTASSRKEVKMIRHPANILKALLGCFEQASYSFMDRYSNEELLQIAGPPVHIHSPTHTWPHALMTSDGIMHFSDSLSYPDSNPVEIRDGQPTDSNALRLFERLIRLLGDPAVRFCRRDDLLPDDFNSDTYSSLNPDLLGLTTNMLAHHYLFHGLGEGRMYK